MLIQLKGLVRITEGNPPCPRQSGWAWVWCRSSSPPAPAAHCPAPPWRLESTESMARTLSLSNSSLETSTHLQGSQAGLSGKKMKPHQPESQQEAVVLTVAYHTSHAQQVFMDQHHHRSKPSHHTPPTAAHSCPGPKPSVSISAALENHLVKTIFCCCPAQLLLGSFPCPSSPHGCTSP